MRLQSALLKWDIYITPSLMKFGDHFKEETEREQKPGMLGDSTEIDCLVMEKLRVIMGMMNTH